MWPALSPIASTAAAKGQWLVQPLEPRQHLASRHLGRVAVAGLYHQVAAFGVGWQLGVGKGLATRVQRVLRAGWSLPSLGPEHTKHTCR